MKIVVITGSTRGIGLGMADAFLAQGCAVVISGRSFAAAEKAEADLATRYDPARVFAVACDVTQFEQVGSLWDAAVRRFGRVDIWINNAGVANAQMDFWLHPPEKVRSVVETNLVGAMYGSMVALRGLQVQGSGSLYNMEGLGSGGGRKVKGLALYASTKAGLSYFNEALIEETQGSPIIVGRLRPGMVVTELLTAQYQGRDQDWARAKRVFNILADRVEKVAPWLVQKVLANTRHGALISYLTGPKVFARFLLAPFSKRKVID
jgi:NAD(P)-dependent dehydrogenase (short-subunit alcohol dehydrogenase family)